MANIENRTFTLKGSQFVECSLNCGVDERRDYGLLSVRYEQLGIRLPENFEKLPIDTCVHPNSPNQKERVGQRRICFIRETVLYEAISNMSEATELGGKNNHPIYPTETRPAFQ